MLKSVPIVVVGAGAAGICAAIVCARRIGGDRVLLLEKGPRIGKKLLATGNGTCNLSNIRASSDCYYGHDPAFVEPALSMFSPRETMAFFESVGVRCEVRENGRIYPLCAHAGAVLDCLREELCALGVQVLCDTTVTALKPQTKTVCVHTSGGTITAQQVLITVGGAASPSLGGSADGYRLLTEIGHTKTPIFPAIVQIKTETDIIRSVKGLRTDASLTLRLDGKVLCRSNGEVLFADYGVSGPAAMMLGRAAADWERKKKGNMTLSVDFLPALSREELRKALETRRDLKGRTFENMLTGLLQKRIGQMLLKAAGLQPFSRAAAGLTDEELDRLEHTVRQFTMPVLGSAGFSSAQVTAGGIRTSEFDSRTMRSKKHERIYAAGECLDIDGECGGLNLQWAWSSAYAAATAMTEAMI